MSALCSFTYRRLRRKIMKSWCVRRACGVEVAHPPIGCVNVQTAGVPAVLQGVALFFSTGSSSFLLRFFGGRQLLPRSSRIWRSMFLPANQCTPMC
ncbi:unnamed protein product [Scytosiphon promiscuus]